MKLIRPLLFMLLVALTFCHLQGQTESQMKSEPPCRAYLSLGTSCDVSGSDFKNLETISFTYRFSPLSSWGGTLNIGYSGFPKVEDQHKLFFSSLTCSFLPVDMERFRIIPSVGFGVAHGDNNLGKFTTMLFDTSVEAQYAVSRTTYCGVEYRYISSRKRTLSMYLAGLKIGFLF